MTYSIGGEGNQISFQNPAQAENNLFSSMRIEGFSMPPMQPSLTIGSSLTDKVSMIATSIQVTPEGNSSFEVTASFTPQDYKVVDQSGASLNMQIGYEFSGKVTIDPMPSSTVPVNETSTVTTTGGFVTGAAMLAGIIPFLLVP